MEIPQGNTREDNKARKQIIKDFYAKWNAEHPDKKIWNASLKGYIQIKGQSINETDQAQNPVFRPEFLHG